MLLNKVNEFRQRPGLAKHVLILVLFIIFAGVIKYYLDGYETTDNAFIDGNVVPISSKVSGYVKTVHINDNQKISKDDIIFEIETTDYEIALQKAAAVLEALTAQHNSAEINFETALISIPSSLDSAKAQYESAQANFDRATADLNRLKGQNNLTRTQKDLDYAIAAYKTAASQVEDVKAKLKSANTVDNAISAQRATVMQLKAQMKQAEADLRQAQENLEDCKVRAPFDGQIVKKTVEVGTFVQPGQSVMSIVGNEFWVIANLKETQLDKIKMGMNVDINIDAYPKLSLKGKVDSIQSGTGSRLSLFPAENATGNYVKVVQRIPVKITFEQQNLDQYPLAVGMSVVPKVNLR